MADAMSFQQIEAKRQTMKLPITDICTAAGIGRRTYDYLLGGRKPNCDTLAKLNLALRRFQTGFGTEANTIAPHAAYKACVVLAAFHLKANAKAALEADPGRKATANAEWMAATQCRWLGVWIANQFFGFKQADLGRAAGMTRGAVQNAIKEIEWERDPEGGDNRELDRIMTQIEEVFS